MPTERWLTKSFMSNKRESIKGKGREVFFSEQTEERQHDSEPSGQSDSEQSRQRDSVTSRQRHDTAVDQQTVKVTLRLPAPIADQLDAEWLKVRSRDRKATKATIVAEALRTYFGTDA